MAAAVVGLLTLGVTPGLAASSSVECGQLTGYIAPDPVGPTDGSLQLGLTPAWVVDPTATVSPAAATTLPTIVNSGPTCLALDFDDGGNITAIDFAPSGTITGAVDFDSGSGFYLFANRLIVPTFITDAYPGLAALFVTSYQAGTELTVTFSVDTTTGQFTGVDGTAAFCGAGSVTDGGDGQVGDAVIPASVLDAADLAALEGAGTQEACATVHVTGTIDQQTNIVLTTDVAIVVAVAASPPAPAITAPPTDTDPAVTSSPPSPFPSMALALATLAALCCGASVLLGQRRGRGRRRR
jgi:hypothetical protein